MFSIAFEELMKHEGGYVHDPIDKGGETYMGIARNHHPDWSGWNIIDLNKQNSNFPKNLQGIAELNNLVQDFYKGKYWNALNCSEYPDIIAGELFEQSVNLGLTKCTAIIQTTCNLLNRNGAYYPDITVDGKFGFATKNTFLTCIKSNGDKLVYNLLNMLQGCHYIQLMSKNKNYEKYIGWFKRVIIIN